MLSDIYFLPAVASISVLIFFYVLYVHTDGVYLGPEYTIWNDFRSAVLPPLDKKLKPYGIRTTNRARSSEFVGRIDADLKTIEQWLWDNGYHRSPIAGLKLRTGPNGTEYEATSWAKRTSDRAFIPDVLAEWQTHVFVFENEDGSHDMYAHYEYSSMNPVVAYKHYRAIDMDREGGVKRVLAELDANPIV